MTLNDIELQLNKAVQFHQAGRIQDATKIYERILNVDPAHADALHLLGFASHQLKRNDKAMDLIQRAIQICPESAPYHNSLGMVLRELGRPNEAVSCYQRALALDPNLVESHNNLGVLLQDLNRLEEAASHFRKALTLRPDIAELYNNMGNVCQAHLQPEKALPYYQKAIEISSDYAEAYYNLGNAYQEMGRFYEALDNYNQAIKFHADYPEVFYNMGNAYQGLEKPVEAIQCYQKALALNPESIEALINMGIALENQGKHEEANSLLKKGLEIDPSSSEIHYYLGVTYQNQGKLDMALASFKMALELNPKHTNAWHHMGIVYQEQGRMAQALTCYKKTLELKPDYPEVYHNKGMVLQRLGKTEEAIQSFKKALDLKAGLSQTHVSLGNAFKEKGRLNESLAYYRKAIEKDPNNAKAHSHLLHQARETCDWNIVDDLVAKLDLLTKTSLERGEKTAEMPFLSLMRETDPSIYLAIARSWSRSISQKMSNITLPFSFKDRGIPKEKITVGYLSNTFRNHPGSHLILGLFRLHNRNDFNVLCYSYGENDGSHYRKRIEQDCDRFADLRDMSHADAADLIYKDEVDILVDLRGHTRGNRFISALRPAPIQISYLGYPGTTGADFYDYLITDKTVSPEEHVQYYSEKFVYMPHCYQINDREQPISRKIWEKKDFHLPEKSFVFCSFNGPNKIEPVMFDVWMRILLKVPGSILWLLKVNEIAEKNLRREALSRGVNPERLVFSEGLPKSEHLARFKLADLALDTRIYNGHTTTSDALWAGVPVVTLKGRYFPARVSASILGAVGLPELVTHSIDEYETLAVRLANHFNELKELKQKLAKNRLTEPLFDTPRFTRNLEKAYKQMWELMLAGKSPQEIEIVES